MLEQQLPQLPQPQAEQQQQQGMFVVPDETMQSLRTLVDSVKLYREENPVISPYAPNTPTLQGRQLNEDTRQFDDQYKEGIRQFDSQFAEDKRQFDAQFAEGTRQFDISTALRSLSSGGGSGGGGGYSSGGGYSKSSGGTGGSSLPSAGTQKDRDALMTATTYQTALDTYDRNRAKGLQYPLYYAVSELLKKDNVKKDNMASGVDVKSIIDNLIITKGGMSPDQYFDTKTGSELSDMYNSLYG